MGNLGRKMKYRSQIVSCFVATAFFTFAFVDFHRAFQERVNTAISIRSEKRIYIEPKINENSPYVIPWKNDSFCSKFKTRFAIGYDSAYLLSYPRSGNTWTRYLLEGATGVFTGSVYNDSQLYKMGYLGEYDPHNSKRLLLIKTHSDRSFNTNSFVDFDQKTSSIVLIIRNPIDAIVSYRALSTNKMKNKNDAHLIGGDPSIYKGIIFRRFVKEQIVRWGMVNEYPLVWNDNLHVVFYEELLQDPLRQVRKILQFLRIPEDPERIECLSKHIMGPAKRQHDKIDPLTPNEKREVTLAMIKLIGLLKLRNIEPPQSYIEMILSMRPSIDFNVVPS